MDAMRAFVVRNALVPISLVAISLGAQAGIALADEPPKLDVAPSCEAAARGAMVIGRDKAACMGDENAALDVLKQNWSKYTGPDKIQCVGNVKTGGPASYVELLSCLEIMRDAKTIREGGTLEGTTPPGSSPDEAPRRRRAARKRS
jgi:hypothetical protein